MKSSSRAACLAAVFATGLFSFVAQAAEPAKAFSQTLTNEQKQRLGLGGLSAAQLAELDAAVGAYAGRTTGQRDDRTAGPPDHGTTGLRDQATKGQRDDRTTGQQDDETTGRRQTDGPVVPSSGGQVVPAQPKPGVIARTLEVFKKKPEEEKTERFTSRVVGEFRGWQGGTYFPLENGQVWRQVGAESNELPPVPNAEVEIYKSSSGYWRLRYEGAWITAKRLQ